MHGSMNGFMDGSMHGSMHGWIEDGSGSKLVQNPPPPTFTFGSAQKRKRKEDLVDVVNLVEEVWLTKNLVDEE